MEIEKVLIKRVKSILKEYRGNINLIANCETVIPYLKRMAECCNYLSIKNSNNPLKKNGLLDDEYIKETLKLKLPKLLKKNDERLINFAPFCFFNNFETKTIKKAMDCQYWLDIKDYSMVEVGLTDATDLMIAGQLFRDYAFKDGCELINSLDTLVRDYVEQDFYEWKNKYSSKSIDQQNNYIDELKIKLNYIELKNTIEPLLKEKLKKDKEIKVKI